MDAAPSLGSSGPWKYWQRTHMKYICHIPFYYHKTISALSDFCLRNICNIFIISSSDTFQPCYLPTFVASAQQCGFQGILGSNRRETHSGVESRGVAGAGAVVTLALRIRAAVDPDAGAGRELMTRGAQHGRRRRRLQTCGQRAGVHQKLWQEKCSIKYICPMRWTRRQKAQRILKLKEENTYFRRFT